MSASEEYLDSLLNAITKQQDMEEDETKEGGMNVSLSEEAAMDEMTFEPALGETATEEQALEEAEDSDISFSPDDIMAMFGQAEEAAENDIMDDLSTNIPEEKAEETAVDSVADVIEETEIGLVGDEAEEIAMEEFAIEEPMIEGAAQEAEEASEPTDPDMPLSPEEIGAVFGQEEGIGQEEIKSEKMSMEDVDDTEEDMVEDTVRLFAESMDDEEDDGALDMPPTLGEIGIDMDDEEAQTPSPASEDMDLDTILNDLGGEDPELQEIGDLLKKSDNHELVDAQVFAALNPDLGDMSGTVEGVRLSDIEGNGENGQKKKKKKGLFSFLRKKENKDEPEVIEDENLSSDDEDGQEEAPDGMLDVIPDLGSILGVSSDTEEEAFYEEEKEGFDTDNIENFLSGDSLEEVPEKVSEEISDGEKTAKKNEKKSGEKKKSIFGRFLEFLMAEDEDEDDTEETDGETGGEEAAVKEKPANGKKGKKEKKGKKGKVTDANDNKAILDEMDAEEDGKKEKKKEKKPKKEKVKKESETPGKKLPVKMILRIFVLCFSIMALLLIVVNILPELMSLSEARNAFYKQQYDVAYQEMTGKKLSESDERIYQKAKMIVRLERKIDAFEYFRTMNMPVEALDALLSGYALYGSMREDIIEYDAVSETDIVKTQILNTLQDVYGLAEEDVITINAMDDYSYTVKLEEITGALSSCNSNYGQHSEADADSADSQGNGDIGQTGNQEPAEQPETEIVLPTEDVLPEEEIE